MLIRGKDLKSAMSPLQFQKRVWLQEARRLIQGEGLDASRFNRQYKSLFGLPPIRDVERLREAPPQNGDFGAE